MSNFLSEAEQVGQDFSGNNSGSSSGDSGLAQTAEKDLSQSGGSSDNSSSTNSSGGGVEDSFVNNGMLMLLHNYKSSRLIFSRRGEQLRQQGGCPFGHGQHHRQLRGQADLNGK